MAERLVMSSYWKNLAPFFFGYEACSAGHTFGPAYREYYLIHYVLSGKGTYYREGKTYAINTGDIFIIRPNEITTYQADPQDPWEYAWLSFLMSEPPLFLDKPVIHHPPVQHIFTYLRDHLQDKMLDGKIYSLTYELLWILMQKESSHTPEDYASYAKTYFELTYMKHITIEDIAKNLHIDRRYLTGVFRKAYGISPKEYLINLRMQKAVQFIQAGHNISEASRMAGFTDLSNFYKQYKARYGTVPGIDRKKHSTR